jgi:hypothetical protein
MDEFQVAVHRRVLLVDEDAGQLELCALTVAPKPQQQGSGSRTWSTRSMDCLGS